MTWTTSTADLRNLLSDGATDRYRYRKKCFGDCNGTNTKFKTFEFRRITSFVSPTAPLGVFKNGASVTVATDYPETGEFVLSAAPVDGDAIEASYYIQWFTDAELATFLRVGTEWLGLNTDPTAVPSGLQPAVIRFAAGEAYMKMAMRWKELLSAGFRLEDMPDPKSDGSKTYMDMATAMKDEARKFRDDYMTRQGQSLQPLFGILPGRVGSPQPRG